MKMGKVEKLLVNSDSHSRQVSHHAERLLTISAVLNLDQDLTGF